MINYSLCLYGKFAKSVDESFTSMERFSSGLLEHFVKLKHVDLKVVDYDWKTSINVEKTFEKIPKCDFLLTPIYTRNVLDNGHLAKEKVKYKTTTFLENKSMWDYSFANLRESSPECYIPYPCSKRFFKYIEKIPKTILLDDHNQEEFLGEDISRKITDWMHELVYEGYQIYQLTKKNDQPHSKIIKPLFKSNYKEYMEQTSKFECFIPTHPGSYENSVIDMVARGTKVLIATDQGIFKRYDKSEGFVAREMIEDFNLDTFKNKNELITAIKKPFDNLKIEQYLSMMTDMEQVVEKIDETYQLFLKNY